MTAKSPLVFDLGLHKGEDTEYYLLKGYTVVAFEANYDLVKECKIKFADAIGVGQLEIIEGAIAPPERGATVTFYMNDLSIWGTIEPNWDERNKGFGSTSTPVKVRVVDLPAVLKHYETPYYIKIDLEGVDRYVIECIAQTGVLPEYVSLEASITDIAAAYEEVDALVRLGYRSFTLVQQKNIPGKTIETFDVQGNPIKHRFGADSSGPFGDDLRQRWLSPEEVKTEIESFFKKIRWFGNNGILTRVKGGRRLVRVIERHTGVVLNGWHDLHARRSDPSRG